MIAGEWTITIPAPAPWLNANGRRDRRRLAPTVKLWRNAAQVYALVHRLPKLNAVHIIATLHFTDRRRRDGHNYYPTLKACVDGLVDYGLIPDDNSKHLDGPDIRIGEPIPRLKSLGAPAWGNVELTIRQVPG